MDTLSLAGSTLHASGVEPKNRLTDFKAIRLHLEELREERAQAFSGEPRTRSPRVEPDAAAHVPPPRARIAVPSSTRPPGSV
jgi:hypothetical protein